jgi:HlyD family secretion protein
MSMTADIETETKDSVLAVPIQSVTTRAQKMATPPAGQEGEQGPPQSGTASVRQRSENKPAEVVFVVENGVAKTVTVKRGISNDAYVEITDGLKEGAEVVSGSYRAINRELEDGAKVRVEEQKKQPGRQEKEGA